MATDRFNTYMSHPMCLHNDGYFLLVSQQMVCIYIYIYKMYCLSYKSVNCNSVG